MTKDNDEKQDITLSSTTDSEEQMRHALGFEEPVKEESEEKNEEESSDEQDSEKSDENEEQEEKDDVEEKEEETSEESDDEESEDDETTDESDTSEDEGSEDSKEKEEKSKPEGKGRAKMVKRINKLTARNHQLQKENEDLRKGKKSDDDDDEKTDAKKDAKVESATDKPKPKKADYKTDEEYLDALTDWKTDLKFAEKERQNAAAAEEKARKQELDGYYAALDTFKATTTDFDEVLEELEEADVSIPQAIQVVLVQEQRPELTYHLAKNLDLCKKLVELNKTSPAKAVLEFGRFVAKLDAESSESKGAEKKKDKSAPASKKPKAAPSTKVPIKPVKEGAAKATVTPLDETDFQEFKRRRAAGEKR